MVRSVVVRYKENILRRLTDDIVEDTVENPHGATAKESIKEVCVLSRKL